LECYLLKAKVLKRIKNYYHIHLHSQVKIKLINIYNNCIIIGGLFLTVGLFHLLPEAHDMIADYIDPPHEHEDHLTKNKSNMYSLKHGDEGPFKNYAFLILILSFTLVLFIEKIATSEDEHHHHHHHRDSHNGVSLVEKKE
jgi:hypothetical protein